MVNGWGTRVERRIVKRNIVFVRNRHIIRRVMELEKMEEVADWLQLRFIGMELLAVYIIRPLRYGA